MDTTLLSEIFLDPEFNCRGSIDATSVLDLVNSIEKMGLMQPIVIQPYLDKAGKKYRIIAGHRRYTAFLVLGRTEIPAVIRKDVNEVDALVLNLSENVDRKPLVISEEAYTIKLLRDRKLTRQQIADKTGKTVSWIQLRMDLMLLPEDVIKEFDAGILSQDMIQQLKKFKDDPDELYNRVRKYKEAKERGEKIFVGKAQNKPSTLQKKRQSRDLEAMLAYLMHHFKEGNIVTRILAWSCGNIPDIELYQELREFADLNKLECTLVVPEPNDASPYLEFIGKL